MRRVWLAASGRQGPGEDAVLLVPGRRARVERQEGEKGKGRTKAKEERKDKTVERASGIMQMIGTLAGGARPGDNQAIVGDQPIATRGPPRGVV